MVKILGQGRGRLDIGSASVNKECAASHESWATVLYIRRLDGPSEGPVILGAGHKVGIFCESMEWRLDIGAASMKKECHADHESWATKLFIKPADGSTEVNYGQAVGIFSEDGRVRLDIGSASVKPCAGTHESWASQLSILQVE